MCLSYKLWCFWCSLTTPCTTFHLMALCQGHTCWQCFALSLNTIYTMISLNAVDLKRKPHHMLYLATCRWMNSKASWSGSFSEARQCRFQRIPPPVQQLPLASLVANGAQIDHLFAPLLVEPCSGFKRVQKPRGNGVIAVGDLVTLVELIIEL